MSDTERARTAVLLVNLGSPESPTTGAVRRYLREFLSDPRVLDMPALARFLLLNLVILPFRPRRSAAAYAKIWTAAGSPLLVHSREFAARLAERLGGAYDVRIAMRYGRPEIEGTLRAVVESGIERVMVVPMFPQYSSAAWGSAVEAVERAAARLGNAPSLTILPPFHSDERFLDAWQAVAAPALEAARPERVLMSFHGLPERHIRKSDPTGRHCLQASDCCDTPSDVHRHCYRAQCFATARGLAQRLGLADQDHEVTFQSRLGRTPWIQPYTDIRLRELARSGVRRVAVLCPSFVTDCLETLEEVALRFRDQFLADGGEELTLVPSLNAADVWVDAVASWVREADADPATLEPPR